MATVLPSLEVAEGVAIIRLRSENGMNALDDAVSDELQRLLDEVESADGIRALVLTGEGRSFSAGGDFAQLAQLADAVRTDEGAADVRARVRQNSRIVERLRALDAVTVAAIDGACIGAALGMALACDARIVTPRATLSTGFISLGLSADFGTAYLLTDAIGRAQASRWLLGGERFTGEAALRAGFATAIAEPGTLLDSAVALAERWSAFPVATAGMKAGIRDADEGGLARHLEHEADRFVAALRHPQAQASVAKAVAKLAR